MKIIWFDYGFSGPEAFGKSRSLDLARALADAGHDVSIVNTLQHMPDDHIVGTTGLFRREQRSGSVRIIEFDLLHNGYVPAQMLSRLRFFGSLVKIAVLEDADLLVSTSDCRSGVCVTLSARLLRGRPFVIDVRSIRSMIDAKAGRRWSIMNRLTGFVKKWAYMASSTIISAGDDLTRTLVRLGFSRQKVQTIANATDRAPFQVAAALPLTNWFKPAPAPGNLVAIYAGRIDVARGLSGLLDVAELLAERGRTDISFVVVGDGPQRRAVGDAVQVRRLDNVFLAGRIDEASFPALLKSCDVGLVLANQNKAMHADFEPANFTAYVAARLPVVANFPGSVAGHVVREDLGVALRPGDPVAFADTLEQLSDNRDELVRMAVNAAKAGVAGNDPAAQKSALSSVAEKAYSESAAKRGLIFKRCLDTIVAIFALIVLLPLFAFAGLAVRLSLGTPVLTGDLTPGLFGRPFRLFRFRSDRDAFLPEGTPSSLVARMIDSAPLVYLPRLINVLRGDLSLVGPPVVTMQDLTSLSGKSFRRHFMRPGLIGPARAGIGVAGDLPATDLWYVENHSTLLDLEIIGRVLLRWPRSKASKKRPDQNVTGYLRSGRQDAGKKSTEENRDGVAY